MGDLFYCADLGGKMTPPDEPLKDTDPKKLFCPICGTHPDMVTTNGIEWACGNNNCNIFALRLEIWVFNRRESQKEISTLQAKIEELTKERDIAREMLVGDQTHVNCGIFEENQRKKLSQATKLIGRYEKVLNAIANQEVSFRLMPFIAKENLGDRFLSPSPKLKEGK